MTFTPEFATTFRNLLAQALLLELEATARVIEAVPNATRDYRPDPRSRSAWELAWHIAADVWFLEGISLCAFQANPDTVHQNPTSSPDQLSIWYRARARKAIESIQGLSSEDLVKPLKVGEVAASSQTEYPAFLYLLFAQNHMLHHRGQLSAYLRSMGGKVPAIYGPSADEQTRPGKPSSQDSKNV
jgi:uncharacterized damage-inducible protein DinB